MFPIKKRERTKEQKAARRELCILMDIPNWDKDPNRLKWRDEIMQVLEPKVESEHQKFYDDRPGLEAKVMEMLKDGATNLEIFDVLGSKNSKRVSYLVDKYKVNRTRMRRLAKAREKKINDGKDEKDGNEILYS